MPDLSLKMVINGSNDGAIAALNQVVTRAQAAGGALGQADSSGAFSKTRAGVESISTQLARLQTLASSALSVQFLVAMAREAIGASDEVKGLESRLKLASRSWQEYGVALAGVRQIAFDSGTAIAANVALVNRVSDPIKRMGGTTQDVLGLTQSVNNALRLTNASAAESAATLLQFAQALGSGVLRGDELNSIMEASPRLAQAIADGLGVTVGELRNLGAQGVLTGEQVFKAVKSQQETLAAEAARLPVTVGMAWTNAMEGIKLYVAELDKGTGATSALASALNTVAGNIPEIADGMGRIALLAGVAFGANMVARLVANVAAQRLKIATSREEAAAAVLAAEANLADQQALARKAAEEVQAIAVTKSYTLATNEAAAADARRAAAARWSVANEGVQAARGALDVAKTAETAAQVGLLGRAMNGAKLAASGLVGLLGGPLGVAIVGITAGIQVWEHFSEKAKKAAEDAQEPVDVMIKKFQEFSSKAGPKELEEQFTKLRTKAAELRDQLLDPTFRDSDKGKIADKNLTKLDAEIDKTKAKLDEIKKFNNELTKERGLFGLDKLKLSTDGLIDQDMLAKLQAFDVLYKAMAERAVTDNGKLKVSALEARAAVEQLIAGAKTPAELSGVVAKLSEVLAKNEGDATLTSQLETAIEARSQAEMKALSSLVSGLEARAKRTQDLFAHEAAMMLAQFSQAQALARVAAELTNDTSAISTFSVGGRNAEVAVAVTSANMQIAAVDQVAARKRQIALENAASTKASADAEIGSAKTVRDERIAAKEKEVAAGKASEAQLADVRDAMEKEYRDKVLGAIGARGQAEANAARQIREIDAESAQARAAIAENLYKSLQGKANDALQQYKQYAQQVIGLDKSISNNRLDTASAIAQLARQNMSPQEQVSSLRDELASIQRATADAMAAGQQDYALELLQRQKALATQIGQAKGDGLDNKRQTQEGIDELQRIGAEAESILQAQRAAAAAAAQQQLESYQQLATAMNALAKQFSALNEQAAIKLKPEIDKGSLDAAISTVQTAFQNLKVMVQVQASTSGEAAAPVTGRAFGGRIPGWSPHARADNILIAATAGEFMVQQPIAQQPGAMAFLEEFNRYGMGALARWSLPGYAYGGLIGGGSMVDRLRIPSVATAVQTPGAQPDVLDLGDLGRIRIRKVSTTADDVTAVLRRAALRYGRD